MTNNDDISVCGHMSNLRGVYTLGCTGIFGTSFLFSFFSVPGIEFRGTVPLSYLPNLFYFTFIFLVLGIKHSSALPLRDTLAPFLKLLRQALVKLLRPALNLRSSCLSLWNCQGCRPVPQWQAHCFFET